MAWSKSTKPRLLKLLNLNWPERILLARAAMLLLLVRIALTVLPFATAMRILGRLSRRDLDSHRPVAAPGPIVWAVEIASRALPGVRRCLVRALAARMMLARSGYAAELKFGAGKSHNGDFRAHAWLESGGRILIGEFESGSYMPMAAGDPNAAVRMSAR
jgi:hypothetical protein